MASVSLRSPFAARLLLAASAAVSLTLAPAAIYGQTAQPTLEPVAFASSSSAHSAFAGEDIDGSSIASDPSGRIKTVAPQYGGGYGGGRYHRYDDSGANHLAIEVGGGLTTPIGNDVNGGFTTFFTGSGQNYGTNTYGGNILGGAGWSFTKRFTLLGEVQYNTSKIPGRTLSAIYNATNAQTNNAQTPGGVFASAGIPNIGGNVHTLSVTAEPVFYYYNSDRHTYAGYFIGGGGYYHKSTNFTAPVLQQDYFGDVFYTNQTFNSYTDSSLGANLGTGVSFKPFGEYSRAKLFLEARYTFVNTPRETAAEVANTSSTTYHTGTEELIPITVGFRF